MKNTPARKALAGIMKQDKSADAKMTPAMIKKDIAANRKNLAAKTKGKNK